MAWKDQNFEYERYLKKLRQDFYDKKITWEERRILLDKFLQKQLEDIENNT